MKNALDKKTSYGTSYFRYSLIFSKISGQNAITVIARPNNAIYFESCQVATLQLKHMLREPYCMYG